MAQILMLCFDTKIPQMWNEYYRRFFDDLSGLKIVKAKHSFGDVIRFCELFDYQFMAWFTWFVVLELTSLFLKASNWPVAGNVNIIN